MKFGKKLEEKIFLMSTFMRNFYAPGYSSMTLSFFNWNLSLRFYRYSGKDKDGFDRYDLKNGITTTVNYENASYLHQTAMLILKGIDTEKEIKAELPCYNATIILEWKPDHDNQMAAYLSIEKNDQSISFRFRTHTVKVMENGQMVTKVIQSGLGAFSMTLESYLNGTGIDFHLYKMLNDFENSQDDGYEYDC